MNRPTQAEISLENLAFNFKSIKSFVGDSVKYMAVVKADAYGHGAVRCSQRLQAEGVDWFGVALPEEGLELRQNRIEKPILCFGSFWHGQENLLLENNLTPVVFRLELLEKLNSAARAKNITAEVHLKVDTGMNRVGVRFDEFREFADKVKTFANLKIDGLMTHFANADDLSQRDFTNLQIARFNECAAILEEKGIYPQYLDLANSPGAIAHPNSRGNMIRLGGIIYGLGDDVLPKNIEKPDLKPVMSLRTKIVFLKKVPRGETIGYSRTFQTTRDSLMATIPIGYHDGYPRALSNQGKAIVNGEWANIAGRVSMDWIVLDVTDVSNVRIGDDVILIGEENGLKIKAEDLAATAETISYEITCGINQRIRKVYID